MHLLLVFNPEAAHGRARTLVPEVRSLFDQRGVEVDLRLTSATQEAVEIVGEADFKKYDGVVAAGGDGTVFEVLNGYFRNSCPRRVPFGVLPVGTGNAYSRDLGLNTREVEKAVDLIVGPGRRRIDVGRCEAATGTFHFLNILGLGFVSDVTEKAHKLKIFGNLSYTLAVILQTVTLRSHTLSIEIDGSAFERENVFCEIANTRYTSNFLMAPDALIDDGKLDVVLLGKVGRVRLLQALPTVFDGRHVHLPEVEVFQARKIKVGTAEPKVLTPDGELFGRSPFTVECLHQALEVFAG